MQNLEPAETIVDPCVSTKENFESPKTSFVFSEAFNSLEKLILQIAPKSGFSQELENMMLLREIINEQRQR